MKTICNISVFLLLPILAFSQQLEFKKQTIGSILSALESRYGYTFLFSPENEDIYQVVSTSSNGSTAEEIMSSTLKNLGIEFVQIEENRFALRSPEPTYDVLPSPAMEASVVFKETTQPVRPVIFEPEVIEKMDHIPLVYEVRSVEQPVFELDARPNEISLPYEPRPKTGVPARLAFVSGFSTDEINPHTGPKHFSANILWGVSDSIKGAELGGLANTSEAIEGLQAAGLYNKVKSNHIGVQAAGLVNTVKGNSKGVQLAGLHNTTYNNSLVQLAGISNVTDTTYVQVAGIFNSAQHVKKLQIGLINYATSSEGVSLGLINVVKQGYNHFECFADEIFWANGQFLFGSRKLHTIIKASYNRKNKDYYRWGFGFGFGTKLALGKKWGMNIQGVSTQIVENSSWESRLNLQNTVSATFSIPIAGIELYAGPSISLLVFDPEALDSNSPKLQSTMQDYPLLLVEEFSNNNFNHSSDEYLWLGFKLGIRI